MKILLEAPEVYILTSSIEDAFAQYVWELHKDDKLNLPKLVSIFQARKAFHNVPPLKPLDQLTWTYIDLTITISP